MKTLSLAVTAVLLVQAFAGCGVSDASIDGIDPNSAEGSLGVAPVPSPGTITSTGPATQQLAHHLGINGGAVAISVTQYQTGDTFSVAAHVVVRSETGKVVLLADAFGGANDELPTNTSMVVNGQTVASDAQELYLDEAIISVMGSEDSGAAATICAASGRGCTWKLVKAAIACGASVGALAAALAACIGTGGAACIPAAVASLGAGAACVDKAMDWFCCIKPTARGCK